ncbi:hypothetical protein ACWDM8_00760 [Streptomyces rubiginosohelvolus]
METVPGVLIPEEELVIITSDRVHDTVPAERIQELAVAHAAEPQRLADELVAAAGPNEFGYRDDATAAVLLRPEARIALHPSWAWARPSAPPASRTPTAVSGHLTENSRSADFGQDHSRCSWPTAGSVYRTPPASPGEQGFDVRLKGVCSIRARPRWTRHPQHPWKGATLTPIGSRRGTTRLTRTPQARNTGHGNQRSALRFDRRTLPTRSAWRLAPRAVSA